MSDVAIVITNNCFQLSLNNGDLETEQGLETAVIISLFSDRRVTSEELPPGISSKRGWWGDLFPEREGDQIGSKVWVLSRAKNTNATVAALENLATESLQWMIEDGVASAISVSAELSEDSIYESKLTVEITRPSGETDRFGVIWDQQQIKRA